MCKHRDKAKCYKQKRAEKRKGLSKKDGRFRPERPLKHIADMVKHPRRVKQVESVTVKTIKRDTSEKSDNQSIRKGISHLVPASFIIACILQSTIFVYTDKYLYTFCSRHNFSSEGKEAAVVVAFPLVHFHFLGLVEHGGSVCGVRQASSLTRGKQMDCLAMLLPFSLQAALAESVQIRRR